MGAGPFAPTRFRKQAEEYFKNHIMEMKTPLEKRFQEMHKGHLTFLQEGEEKYLNPDLIKAGPISLSIKVLRWVINSDVSTVSKGNAKILSVSVIESPVLFNPKSIPRNLVFILQSKKFL